MNRAEAFVDEARELSVMPPLATEVLRKAEDPDTAVKVIAELISRDAALAVRVLKIASSSFYSMSREVQSIQQTIMLPGWRSDRARAWPLRLRPLRGRGATAREVAAASPPGRGGGRSPRPGVRRRRRAARHSEAHAEDRAQCDRGPGPDRALDTPGQLGDRLPGVAGGHPARGPAEPARLSELRPCWS